MIPVGRDEVLFCHCYKIFIYYILRKNLHRLQPEITREIFHSGKEGSLFVLQGSCHVDTKFSHGIASARLSEMKKLVNTCLQRKIKRKCIQI